MKMFAALLALALVAGPALAQTPAPSTGITDADILNFALNLEYLEANFYSCAAFGTPVPDTMTGGGPAVIGCEMANLTGNYLEYGIEIANNELDHVAFLRAALGSAAVPQPLINIGSAFAAAADAALNMTLDPPFSPYGNELFFLHGAFIFEDLGVTAYHGAAPLIVNPTYLSAAAGILAVEAYHAGIIRTLLYEQKDVVTPYGVTPTVIIGAIADLENAAGGVFADDGLVSYGANGEQMADLVNADSNSIAYSRTPMEVLNIAYLGDASTPGGFFPDGVNGYFGPVAA